MPKKRRELLLAEAAELAGVKEKTWSGYVTRGQAPSPTRHVGRTPLWDEAEVTEWVAARPGQGARKTTRARSRASERKREAKSRGES